MYFNPVVSLNVKLQEVDAPSRTESQIVKGKYSKQHQIFLGDIVKLKDLIFYLIFWFYSLTLRGGCFSGSRPGHLLMRRSMPKYPQAGILSCPPMRSLEYKCSIKRHFGIKKSPWVNEASCVKRFECLSSAKKHYFQTSPFQISFLPVC